MKLSRPYSLCSAPRQSLDGETTVMEFIRLTENAYGGATIRKLKEQYK